MVVGEPRSETVGRQGQEQKMATRTWQLETVLIDSDVMLETVTDVGDWAFALKYRRRVLVFDLWPWSLLVWVEKASGF